MFQFVLHTYIQHKMLLLTFKSFYFLAYLLEKWSWWYVIVQEVVTQLFFHFFPYIQSPHWLPFSTAYIQTHFANLLAFPLLQFETLFITLAERFMGKSRYGFLGYYSTIDGFISFMWILLLRWATSFRT